MSSFTGSELGTECPRELPHSVLMRQGKLQLFISTFRAQHTVFGLSMTCRRDRRSFYRLFYFEGAPRAGLVDDALHMRVPQELGLKPAARSFLWILHVTNNLSQPILSEQR